MSTPDNGAHGWARRFRRIIFLGGLGFITAVILAFAGFVYLNIEYNGSADGNTLAVSSGLGKGTVVVFRGNDKGEMEQLGQALNGDSDGDQFGYSTSLSVDGNILVVGAPGYGSDRQGYVRVYYLENDNDDVRWKQLGQDIKDTNGFGYSVALSGDGKTIAVGENLYANGNNVRVYRMNDAGFVWIRLGGDTDGDNAGYSPSKSKRAVAKPLEVGCLLNNNNVTDSVHTEYDHAYANLLNSR